MGRMDEDMTEAYIQGFLTKCAESNVSVDTVVKFIEKRAFKSVVANRIFSRLTAPTSRIPVLGRLLDRLAGTKTVAVETPLFHGGLPKGSTVSSITANHTGHGQSLFAKGKSMGFYLTDEKNMADKYTKGEIRFGFGGMTRPPVPGATTHQVYLSPDARVAFLQPGMLRTGIEHIEPSEFRNLARKYDAVQAVNSVRSLNHPKGYVETVILNPNKIKELRDVGITT